MNQPTQRQSDLEQLLKANEAGSQRTAEQRHRVGSKE
jgi:hypothetical protein